MPDRRVKEEAAGLVGCWCVLVEVSATDGRYLRTSVRMYCPTYTTYVGKPGLLSTSAVIAVMFSLNFLRQQSTINMAEQNGAKEASQH